MNKQESDILKLLYKEPFQNQRLLAERSGHSLGVVNRSVKALMEEGYLDKACHLSEKSKQEFAEKKPQRAVILAAGFGMRMVPINTETPKALIKVHGECLIERQIQQLHEAGIMEIYVVVGFLKEYFEYLIDDYGVTLLVNLEYAEKGNLYSLQLAAEYLENAYIVPCDIWCDANPFSSRELYSWYMVSDLIDDESEVRVNRKGELVKASKGDSGNAMIGIAYLLKEDAEKVRAAVESLCVKPENHACFWETALYRNDRMFIPAKVVHSADVVEINTYEQLRELDSHSEQLQSDAIEAIQVALHVEAADITDIIVQKKGITNRSFLFSCKNQKYIMRIPEIGSDELINRREEASVYHVLANQGICDEVCYIQPENGYKISKFIQNARVCNPLDENDLKLCMQTLRRFHKLGLKVNHEFNIFKQIDFYESLWQGKSSAYKDYQKTKQNVLSLQPYMEKYAAEKVLTHIDAVSDNFLIYPDETGKPSVCLIDWEYAGMQDPHVDIAMFCVYALYDKEQVDRLIDIYFENECPEEIRIKIYGYIAAAGLLWSNWCEYKRQLGIEFGTYSLKQYRYAKEYYRLVVQKTGTDFWG